MLIARARRVEVRMTLFTAVSGDMRRMTENRAARPKVDLLYSMAFLTVRLDTKSRLAIVTRSAGVPGFHGSHAVSLAGFAGYIQPVMAIGTLEQSGMDGMSEDSVTGLFNCEYDIYRRLVAFVTITLDAENGRSVMAAAAGCAFFHLCHCHAIIVRPGVIRLIMAISAGINRQVPIMIETGIVRKQDLFHRMTFTALLDVERGFSVMTRTARFPFIHISHAEAF